ncbi:MAG TPA: ribokinase, partial [Candidatus Sulfotelmatobacter sp.]|nr:ribokinase [Candidatus Sulfotelmatobacter sp.]
PTGVGFILVEGGTGNNCIALDPGANELLSPSDVAGVDQDLEDAAVVLAQLEIPVPAAEAALACGRRHGATTILNPAPARHLPKSVLEKVDVLTPNRTEANVLTGRTSDAHADPETVAHDLIQLGVKTIVMTLGEKGALMVTASSSRAVPAIEMKAVDSTGAGDAFNAGLATALAFGATLEEAVEFAVVTGGLAVTKAGVIPSLPTQQEVAAFYERSSLQCPHWFISTRQTGK